MFRPRTLIPPAVGMITGALVALGAQPKWQSHIGDTPGPIALNIFLGALMAMLLNSASNTINQIADIENDTINKPHRVIPLGQISIKEAWVVGMVVWIAALIFAYIISLQCFWVVTAASVFIFNYSMPPLRFKSRTFLANFAIAIPRGLLLPVAAWSSVKTIYTFEPWIIGSVFFIFIFGAATTKDFSDIEGDRYARCNTLPVRYGTKTAAYIISPFFILPFVLIPIFSNFGYLTGNKMVLWTLALLLVVLGIVTLWSILKDTDALAADENHSSWTYMYLMMVILQSGLALAYLI